MTTAAEVLAGNATWAVVCSDALALLRTLPDDAFDAVVTDPPAGIEFMGAEWDTFRQGRLKNYRKQPGGTMADGAPTGVMAAKGFTKPLPQMNQKANPRCQTCGRYQWDHVGRKCECAAPDWVIDNSARQTFVGWLTVIMAECLRVAKPGAVALVWALPRTSHWTGTACEDAGWVIEDRIAHLFGTGFPKHSSKLKPAVEDWWVCRKPGPKWLGVDAARIGTTKRVPGSLSKVTGLDGYGERTGRTGQSLDDGGHNPDLGRWPANVALSHHEECGQPGIPSLRLDGTPFEDDETPCVAGCPVAELDRQSGERPGAVSNGSKTAVGLAGTGTFAIHPRPQTPGRGDSGGASRFFFCAKASREDRGRGNGHPTVKSTALMAWLCKLACPPGGAILDPFCGSGSTVVAALRCGFRAVGVEKDEAYAALARRRVVEDAPLFNGAAPGGGPP